MFTRNFYKKSSIVNGNKEPIAVILGLSPTGLHAVRELALAGVVVVGISRGYQSGAKSRYLSKHYDIQPTNTEELLKVLRNIKTVSCSGIVLLPTSDDYVNFIESHHESLSEICIFPDSYRNGISKYLSNKSQFYDFCKNINVQHALFSICKGSELSRQIIDFDFPYLIKPAKSYSLLAEFSGKKAKVINCTDDLNILIKQLILATDEVVIQEIIPGPDSNLTLYTSYRRLDGVYFAEFTGRKLRQFPPGFGSASCAYSSEEPETASLSRRILDELNYEGIAATEFKVDSRDGSLKVIEINARPGLWYELTSGSNVKCILAYYKILTGLEFYNTENEQVNGVYWKYGAKDLYTKLFYFFKGKHFLLGTPASVKLEQTRTVYPVFNVKDIKPFVSEFNVYLKKSFKKFF